MSTQMGNGHRQRAVVIGAYSDATVSLEKAIQDVIDRFNRRYRYDDLEVSLGEKGTAMITFKHVEGLIRR